MTRKLIFLFLLLSTGFFFLLNGIFGEKGYFSNLNLKDELEKREYLMDLRNVELENLEKRYDELTTDDGLREAAMKLGYNIAGDEVYRFDSQSVQDSFETDGVISIENEKAYRPLSGAVILLISIALSSGVVLVAYLARRISEVKEKENDIKQKEPRDYSDGFFLNS